MLISKRLLLINSASGLVTQGLQLTVMVWLHAHLTRRIPSEEYSTYFLVTTLMAFAPILGAILTSGQTRFILVAFARGDEREITEITSTIFPIVLGAAALVMTVGGVAAWQLDWILKVTPENLGLMRGMLLLTLGLFSLQLACSPFGCGLVAHQRYVLINGVRLCTELLRVCFLCALLFGLGPRVLWVVVSQFVADVTALLVTVHLSMRSLPALRFRRESIRWQRGRELTLYGSWVLALNTAAKLSTALGIFVLNQLRTPLEMTQFSLAVMPYRRLDMLESVASRPLVPVLAAMYAQDAPERLRNSYLRGGRIALWCVLFLVVPLVVYRVEIIELWLGPASLPVAAIMALVLASTPLKYANVVLGKIAVARNRVRPLALFELGTQGLHLMVLLILVTQTDLGALGAGLATGGTLLLGEIAKVPFGLGLAGAKPREWLRRLVLPGLAPALVGGLAWAGLRQLLVPRGLFELALCLAAGALVYGFGLFLALRERDRQDLREILRRLRRNRRTGLE